MPTKRIGKNAPAEKENKLRPAKRRRAGIRRWRGEMPYFRGSIKEAESIGRREISELLEEAGIGLKDGKEASKSAGELMSRIRRSLKRVGNNQREILILRLPRDGAIHISVKRGNGGRVLIRPEPVVHGVRGHNLGEFDALRSILKNGFRGFDDYGGNVIVGRRSLGRGTRSMVGGKISGDRYSIEMVTETEEARGIGHSTSTRFVPSVGRERINAVNIELDGSLSGEEAEARKRYYRRVLKGVPIRFF